MKTRAAHMKSPWQFEVREVELPDEPPAGWAIIRVEACGICGTDLTGAEKGYEDWKPFGHEIAGVIEKLPAGVAHLEAGQKVVLESASFCGHCAYCRNGRVDLCAKAPHFWLGESMGMSDFMLAPVCCVVPYEGLSPEAACQTEPCGVAYDMVKVSDVRLGDRVCVVGPGPIGLAALAMAKHAGAVELVCIGRAHSKARLALAERIGARAIGHDGGLGELEELQKRFDHVLVTAPVNVLPGALGLLGLEGRCTYVGIGTGDGRITFDANDFHFRKLQLRASFASPAMYFPRVLELMRAGIVPAEEMVSHRFALADVEKAMLMNRDAKDKVLKVVVKPSL
jgi:L-iditol 2-dehydrogenase